jgi:hypothetical protein
MAEQYYSDWMYYLFKSRHQLVDVLDCFHPFPIMNTAAVNMGPQVSVQVPIFSSFGYAPRSGIAGSYFLRNNYFMFS